MIDNPFERRATEYLRDDEAFLSVIAPEPLIAYIAPFRERIYDRLVVLRGTPGSGKSTLARLFEFSVLVALLKNPKSHVPLVGALEKCGALKNSVPSVLACRLLLESDYRDIWEFPYPEELKHTLLITLLQARAVLVWCRQLQRVGITDESFRAVPADPANASFESAGTSSFSEFENRARAVEREIFGIVSALIPPKLESLRDFIASHNYRPFEAISGFEILLPGAQSSSTIPLQPMVILDDAHILHPQQLAGLQRWLIRRELRLARWILSRLDVEKTETVLAAAQRLNSEAELPGVTKAREVTEIDLQSDRSKDRQVFRRMAKDMANRYLRLMPQFVNRKIDDFSLLLADIPEPLSATNLRDLRAKIASTQKRMRISESRLSSLRADVERYRTGSRALSEDETLAVLLLLMHRYGVRTRQDSLFEVDNDPEPTRKLTVHSGVYQGAKYHLFRAYGKAFFYGLEDLCDASSENAEQFLRLAAALVDAVSARMVRQKVSLALGPALQHELLTERAREFVRSWTFPYFDKVHDVTKFIADVCSARSSEPNAPLDAGANAYGVPQSEFEEIVKNYPQLALVIKFGLAYNALSLNPEYECKNKTWCLIQLGGLPILHFGLPLKRGGFVEGSLADLAQVVS